MLDRRGEVREDASPRLAALRRQIRTVRDQIYRDLGEFVSSHKDELSEETIPMRGGRLVVVLQSGARGRSGGLVHGRSATGRSFYFEPLHVVETNNTLQQSVEDEEAERRRILAELIDGGAGGAPRPARALAISSASSTSCRPPCASATAAAPCSPRSARGTTCASCWPATPCSTPASPTSARRRSGQAGHSGEIVPLARRAHAPAADPGDHRPQRRRQDGVAEDRRHPRPDGPVRAADPGRAGEPGAVPRPAGGDRRRRAGPAGRPLHLQRPAAPPQGGLGVGGAGQPRPARRAGLGHRSGRGRRARRGAARGAAREGEPGGDHHPSRAARGGGAGAAPAPPARRWSSIRRPAAPPSGWSRGRRAPARRWRSPAGSGCPPSGWTAPRRGWAPSTATCGG